MVLVKAAALYLYTLSPHTLLTNSAVMLAGLAGAYTTGLRTIIFLLALMPQPDVYARLILSPILTDELFKYLIIIIFPSVDPESNTAERPTAFVLKDHEYPEAATDVAVAIGSAGAT